MVVNHEFLAPRWKVDVIEDMLCPVLSELSGK